MIDSRFPAWAWPDMCAAYRDAGLAQACLALQQAFSVDVPLLLVLSLANRAGYGIAPAAVEEMATGAAAWRDTVIVPLRQARRAMKLRFTASLEAALREDIKRLEQQAEHQHVLRLIAALPPAHAGEQGVRHYLTDRGLTGDATDDFIETFAAACEAEIVRTAHE